MHPEGREEVVPDADAVGSTDFICRYVEKAAPGTSNYSETEINPVRPLARENPDERVLELAMTT